MFMDFIGQHTTIVLVHVDDLIVTVSDSKYIQHLISLLNTKFSLKDLDDLHFFLGIKVKRTNNNLHLSQ